MAERQKHRQEWLQNEAQERVRKAERDAEYAEEQRLHAEQQKAKEVEAIKRRQLEAEEAEAAEARRSAELCQRHMLEEQEAIRTRNIMFLKESEYRKHALARAKESKRKRALMAHGSLSVEPK